MIKDKKTLLTVAAVLLIFSGCASKPFRHTRNVSSGIGDMATKAPPFGFILGAAGGGVLIPISLTMDVFDGLFGDGAGDAGMRGVVEGTQRAAETYNQNN